MGVFAHVERTIDSLAAAVVTNGLRDGQDVRLGEGPVERRPPVAASPKADHLRGVTYVGLTLEVFLFEPGDIDEHLLRRRLACQWRDRHPPV